MSWQQCRADRWINRLDGFLSCWASRWDTYWRRWPLGCRSMSSRWATWRACTRSLSRWSCPTRNSTELEDRNINIPYIERLLLGLEMVSCLLTASYWAATHNQIRVGHVQLSGHGRTARHTADCYFRFVNIVCAFFIKWTTTTKKTRFYDL